MSMLGDPSEGSRPFDAARIDPDLSAMLLHKEVALLYEAQSRLVRAPFDQGLNDIALGRQGIYGLQYEIAVVSQIEASSTFWSLLHFAPAESQERESALMQALRQRTPNPLRPREQKKSAVRAELAVIGDDSEAAIRKEFADLVDVEYWSKTGPKGRQKQKVVDVLTAQLKVDIAAEHETLLRAARPLGCISLCGFRIRVTH